MRLGHVHIKVADLKAAEDFYTQLLGMRVTERLGNDFIFLTNGAAHHELALQQASHLKPPPPGGIGLYHSAFETTDLEEFRASIRKMQQMKLGFTIVDHGISWAAYTEDPSSNGVEIFIDRRSNQNGTSEWHGHSRLLRPADVL